MLKCWQGLGCWVLAGVPVGMLGVGRDAGVLMEVLRCWWGHWGAGY